VLSVRVSQAGFAEVSDNLVRLNFRDTQDAALPRLSRLTRNVMLGLDGSTDRATFFGRLAGFSIKFPTNPNTVTAKRIT
jgi:hypothetical protein